MRRISASLTAILVLLLSSSCAQAGPDRCAQVTARIQSLAHTGYSRVLQIGKSSEGRPLYAIIITDPQGSTTDRARVLFICGQHGDETSSVTAMVHLAEQFSQTSNSTHQAILRRAVIAIVPVANPDGFSRSTRQNGRGVDLNRDWASASQSETEAIRRLVSQFSPQIVVDEHEWLDGGPTRRTSVEVPGFGHDRQHTLARLVAGIASRKMAEVGTPIGISHYQEQANPSLAHREFTRAGICSMLIETTPDLSPRARARVYDFFAKELLLTVAFPPEPRVSACLDIIGSRHKPMAPVFAALFKPEAPMPNWLYPCAVLSIAFIMVVATMIGRGARRRAEVLEPVAVTRVRPMALGIMDVLEMDASPREKLEMLREYRSRPVDRQDPLRKPVSDAPVLLDPSENRALNKRWDSDITRRVLTPAPPVDGRHHAARGLARLT